MSAIRSSHSRASERRKRSTPYGRSIISTFVRFLGFGGEDEESEELPSKQPSPPPAGLTSESTNAVTQDAPTTPQRRLPNNKPIVDTFPAPTPLQRRAPFTPARNFNCLPDNGSTETNDLTHVASYLSRSAGRPVTDSEVEGMLAMLRNNSPPETNEPFRFSSSTPHREASPSQPNHSGSTPSTPRKTLTRNPNGVYRWQGAGSARKPHRRNQYSSPAFGASPAKSERVILKESVGPSEPSRNDGKRRKMDDSETSLNMRNGSPEHSNPVPFPSNGSAASPRSNGVTSHSGPAPSLRLRTPVKPSAPVVPSPLRQAWSEVSSNSSQESLSQPPKQTKTANFMAELIKETTPPKRPDLSNPYQTASPVSKVGPPRRSARRPRATGRPAVPAQIPGQSKSEQLKKDDKVKEPSPQAIIEATLPKGVKRSRPPVNLEKSTSSTSGSSEREPLAVQSSKVPYVVEEVETDEEERGRATKKSKPSLSGLGPAPATQATKSVPLPDITVEEINDDVLMEGNDTSKEKDQDQPATSATTPVSRSTFPGPKANTIPKEPSKLRYSFQADVASTPSSPAPALLPAPVTPAPPAKSGFQFTPPSKDFSFTFAKPVSTNPSPESVPPHQAKINEPAAGHNALKRKAAEISIQDLPTFVLTSSGTSILPSSLCHVEARKRVQAIPISSLPKYDLPSSPSKTLPFKFSPLPTTTKSAPFTHGTNASSPTPKPFTPFAFSSSSTSSGAPQSSTPFTFGLNAASTTPKSSTPFLFKDNVPNASTPPTFGPSTTTSTMPSAPAVKGFDFKAAGMAPPSVSNGTWTCSLCALSNPASASKCETCETDKPNIAASNAPPSPPPAVSKPPAPPAKAFDWSAAGLMAPTVSKDTWTCSLCALSNPSSAKNCETCDTPK